MLNTVPPWPTPQISNITIFRSPFGLGRVTPSIVPAGTERIELLTAGSVYDDAGQGETLALPGTVFWHLPGEQTIHRYPVNDSYECLCINLLPADGPARRVPRVTAWDDVPAAQAFAREIIDCDAIGQLRQPAFVAYVYHRLFWNALAWSANIRYGGSSVLTDACTFIRANLTVNLSVATIARTIGTSPSHLHHLFRIHLGHTPHGFMLAERFQKACNLLRGTRLQSKEIAYQCGFRDAAEFSRTFRRFAGCSPREYRLPPSSNPPPSASQKR